MTDKEEERSSESEAEMAFAVKILLQSEKADIIKLISDETSEESFREFKHSMIESKIRILEGSWETFKINHDQLANSFPQLYVSSNYCSEKTYSKAFVNYSEAKAKLEARLDDIKPALRPQLTQSSNTSAYHLFEKIKLRPFTGQYQDWKEYEDMFLALIGNNSDIPDVHKMSVLKSSVMGDAARLISHMKVTGENYPIAWSLLVSRYENRRLLISSQLDKLFGSSSIIETTSKGLHELLNSLREALDSLKALGTEVEQWDLPLVYHIVRRLDSPIRKEWERKLGSTTEYPTLQALQEFLKSEATSLESIELTSGEMSKLKSSLKSTPRSQHSSARSYSTSAQLPPQSKDSQAGISKPNPTKPWMEGFRGPDDPGHTCDCCGGKHYIASCNEFRSLPAIKRHNLVMVLRLCCNCLGRHAVQACRSSKTCWHCGIKHHTLIHLSDTTNKKAQSQPTQPKSASSSQNQAQQQSTSSALSCLAPVLYSTTVLTTSVTASQENIQLSSALHQTAAQEVFQQAATLLATARALIIAPVMAHHPVRILLDSGSELSFITNELSRKLQLPKHSSTLHFIGIGNTTAGRSKGVSLITLKALHSTAQIQVPVHSLNKLTTVLPSCKLNGSSWKHLDGLQLADQDYKAPGNIDIILGSTPFSQIIRSEIIRGEPSDPVALNTIFGWIVFGPTQSNSSQQCSPVLHLKQDHALHELLTRFWIQEETFLPHSAQLSPEEELCEAHFLETHARDLSGRYTVRLPISQSISTLGDSRNSALRCLKFMLKRLLNDPNLNKLYRDFMSEYEALGHMRIAPEVKMIENESSTQVNVLPHYYMPHHGVLREQSLTTKLRVVFNGSAPTSSSYSLNDILHTGAKLQLDIFNVLLWIRRHKIIFCSDITKMFRQINVHPADWDLQRILWLDDHDHIVPYQLTTVTYGTRSAPFLAVRVLLQLIQDEGLKYPLAIEPMMKGRYVDDIYGGSDTLQEAQLIAQDLIKLCMAGRFPLAKWSSNNLALLQLLSIENISITTAQALDDTELKVLGLSWNSSSDQFIFSPKLSTVKKITKRTVLSEVAQLFDPLGFLAPVIVRAKMFIQELWLNKSGWDDELPEQLIQRWTHLRNELPQLAHIHIPRWLNTLSNSYIELHGFSDASQLAMAACVYIKVLTLGDSAQVMLLCAKTKVAPLKPVTIPRLELTAAWMLAKLIKHVQQILELPQAPLYLWTDSSVALTWILSHPSKWKEYVRNRVSSIQELNPTAKWLYVPGKQNPADCASRGLTSTQLMNFNQWWNGPDWLLSSSSSWPTQQFKPSALAHKEERPGVSLHAIKTPVEEDHPLWYLLSRYSTLYKLLRVIALCSRFHEILKKLENKSVTSNPISPQDLLNAQLILVKIFQKIHFSFELKALQENIQLPSSHCLSKLTAFLDEDGILRVGGRLANAPLEDDEMHPIILPRKSRFTQLVIDQAHRKTLHGGVQLTLMTIREKFWILGGRAPIRSFILKCVICARFRAQRAQQLMGQLPASRVNAIRPFHTTGVDYAGPFMLKTFQGRGAKKYKGWIAVFVCFVTSAVHLEVVSSYSTEAFIKAYRRFISRRGASAVLYSDRGTNFRGADSFLKELFRSSSQENAQLVSSLAQIGTRWVYSPPDAPHFGGKWEAAVKSVKSHLVRVVKNTLLTFEDMSTLLAQIEAVLNSRPLSPLSDDPEDLRALTPAHFLHSADQGLLPDIALTHFPESRLALWQLIQQRLQHFWQRWSKECLQRYQSISKWTREAHEIKLGTLVLIADDNFPPAQWPLARVIEVHPGKDGLIRVVTVRTSKTTLTRPIAKLIVLPVDSYRNDVAVDGEYVARLRSSNNVAIQKEATLLQRN